MKLREYKNRFKDFNLIGAILDMNPKGYYNLVLKYYSEGLAWFIDKDTYPAGVITFISMSPDELLDMEVVGWMDFKVPLMEGDRVMFHDGHSEIVTRVKEGDASPFPIVTKQGQYKWDDITMVMRGE